jgi:hypothetical protein
VLHKVLNYITSGATSLIAKYALRASVAIPFLLAFGFGLAGVAVLLIEAFGYRDAYFLLAAGFAALGMIAVLAVWIKERREATDSRTGTPEVIAKTVKTAGALAGGTSEASSNLRLITGLAARNWPLVIIAGIAILLLGGPPHENRYEHRYKLRF